MSVSQLSNRLSIDLSGFPEGAAEAFRSFAALLEEGPGRGDPEAFAAFEVGLHKRLMGLGRAVLGKCAEDWDENDGPVRRDGRVFYRSTEATSKTHTVRSGHVLPFAVPLAGKPVVLAGRRKPGPAIISRIRRRTALSRSCAIARDGAEIFERLGGMTPSSSCLKRLLTRAGKRWKAKEEAMDVIREAETGEAVRRLA